MSFRTIHEDESDHQLKHAVRNAFALLRDVDILLVCQAIEGSSAGAAADSIINLVGPEATRVAIALPNLWGPSTLADSAVAAQVLTAAAQFKGKGAATKAELKRTVDALDVPPPEKELTRNEIDRMAGSAVEWAAAGHLVSSILINALSSRIPLLRVASRIPFVTRLLGTAAGAGVGIARALPPSSE